MQSKKTRALFFLVFTMLVWGSSYSVTKSVVDVLPPGCFTLLRFAIALLCLLPFFLREARERSAQKFRHGDFYLLFLMGLSGITGYYIFFNYSLMYTSASDGALIQGFIPVCIALFGVVFLKEKLSVLQMFGIGLSFAGVVLVGLISAEDSGEKGSLTGNLLMVASVLCWTTYTLISRKLSHLDPLTITFWSACMGTALLLPVGIYEFVHHSGHFEIPWNGWLALIYLGAISSAFCYLMYNKALELLPAAVVGNFLNLDILIGVLIAIIFLHERLDAVKIIGGVLILSGLILSSRKKPA